MVGAPPGSSDDQPTVISKNRPAPPARTEEFLGGKLRGRRLAHFELIDAVGVGGMAAVLRARDTQLDRVVALKILPPEMATDEENVRRFHQEARAAAKLDHENIARVFFCGEDQKLHFIAFEFVEGENLRTLIEHRGRLGVREAVNYLLQIATGLVHAANRGVVHRDIKPSNLIITPTGRAKLVDMGLARSLGPQSDPGLTQSGVTLGTFDYIPPEQALEPRDADVRSDIYSLGCTFYHALTGQAPVPEGTPAKKLHHHQNVAPLDPRQLNPEIPDDLAAVLARMMAKDPKDRYPDAERLVQHLFVVAQKVGAAPEVPEGVLFVEAPLPNPPGRRPLVLAAVAAVALVGLIFLVTQPPPWATAPPGDPSVNLRPKADDPNAGPGQGERGKPSGVAALPTKDAVPDRPPSLAPPRYDSDRPTPEELHAFLREHANADELDIVLGGDLRLPGNLKLVQDDLGLGFEPPPTLVVRARKVTLRAKHGVKRPTVWLEYDGRTPPAGSFWAALTFQTSDEVRVQGLRFLVDAKGSDTNLAALLLEGARSYQISDCEFLQAWPAESDQARLCSVVVRSTRPEAPTVTLKDCYFAGGRDGVTVQDADKGRLEVTALGGVDKGGQEALAIAGKAHVKVQSCAFGPHAVLFRLQGKARDDIRLDVLHCSALLGGESAVFVLDKAASCKLQVSHCLFSQPASFLEGEHAVLVRQAGEGGGLVFEGRDNRYHNLSAFWTKDNIPLASEWPAFASAVAERRGRDDKSLVLPASPWSVGDPLAALEKNEPGRAFEVNKDLPELRLNNDPASRRAVGVERGVWGLVAELPRLPTKQPEPVGVARKKQKVVDPKVEESGNGVYPSLAAALGEAKPGDEILIKHSGLLPVENTPLEKPTLEVTVKPYDNTYHPVLTLGDTSDREASLFRVHSGRLTLENLEFLLRPKSGEFKSQCVVAVFGDGHCTLRDCVATLVEDGKGVPLSVVTFVDPNLAMTMTPAAKPGRPRLELKGCFVRGEGDLIAVKASRAFDGELENVLAALTGSLLNLEGRQDDTPAAANAAVQLRLDNVTTHLGGYLVRLRSSKDAKAVVPVQLRPSACLFVAANGNALVHLEGFEPTETQLRSLLGWEGQRNRYANFLRLLDVQPPEEGMMMPARPFDQDKWRTFTGEADAQFVRGKFDDLPAQRPPLHRTVPSHFKTEAGGAGADVGSLPRPAEGASDRTENP